MDAVEVGSIVQLGPECRNPAFRYSLMVVTELKSWGVQGYVQALGDTREGPGGQAYYRAQRNEFELTGGRVVWAPEGSLDDEPT